MHHDQDEWMYIVDGEFDFEIGGQLLRAHTGDTVFLPRKVAHGWTRVGNTLGKVLNTYQPRFQILQGTNKILIAYEFAGATRAIHMDKVGTARVRAGWAGRVAAGTATRSSSK